MNIEILYLSLLNRNPLKNITMEKENLVVLKKNQAVMYETETLRPHVNYRCIELRENGKNVYLVYGLLFDEKTYNDLFETSHERVIRDFNELGLFQKNGKPISKNKFLLLSDVHVYGKGRQVLRVFYIRDSSQRIYGFYPSMATKQEQLKECYDLFLDIVNGDVEPLDSASVCFGNCGIPIYYGILRTQ